MLKNPLNIFDLVQRWNLFYNKGLYLYYVSIFSDTFFIIFIIAKIEPNSPIYLFYFIGYILQEKDLFHVINAKRDLSQRTILILINFVDKFCGQVQDNFGDYFVIILSFFLADTYWRTTIHMWSMQKGIYHKRPSQFSQTTSSCWSCLREKSFMSWMWGLLCQSIWFESPPVEAFR